VVVDVVVIDFFVFDCSLLSVVNGLQLMAISEVSMVCGRDDIILVVRFSGKALVLCSCFEVVGSGAMMLSGVVMDFVLVRGCHNESPEGKQQTSAK